LPEFRVVKSCCNSTSWLFIIDKPISRSHISIFEKSGYTFPAQFIKSGLFYAKKDSFIATTSFGLAKINARCGGANCEQIRDEFMQLLTAVEAQ